MTVQTALPQFDPAKLVAAREAAGLSRAQLAEATGVSRQTIFFIETKKSLPNIETAFAIADALGVKVDQFRVDARQHSNASRSRK